MADADKFLTTLQVAEAFPFLKPSWLERARRSKSGPPYVKFGEGKNCRVLYPLTSLKKWIKEKETE